MQPRSPNDFVALQHDIDYLSGNEPILSDINAIMRGNNSLDGLVLKLGLGARTVADILAGPYHRITHFNGSKYKGAELTQLQKELETISGSRTWNPFYWK